MWEFLLVALVVTLTPGPATALVLRVAARDGRRAAIGAIVGNEIGVLTWALLSAVGVSSLIVASEVAYDVLRFGGAAVLIVLGLRSLLHRASDVPSVPRWTGWRTGLLSSAANPKLAVFFVALFPQFLSPHTAVLPAALAMAVMCRAARLRLVRHAGLDGRPGRAGVAPAGASMDGTDDGRGHGRARPARRRRVPLTVVSFAVSGQVQLTTDRSN